MSTTKSEKIDSFDNKEINAIEIKNLNFSFGKRKILNDISMIINTEKLTAIIGPNGCGKSTLLQNVLGFLKSESGYIELFNENTKGFSQKKKAQKMSFVPQKSRLQSPVTVHDFTLLGRLPHLKNAFDGYTYEDHKFTSEILEKMHLTKFVDRLAISLSGGEFQMVLLARALVQNTKIMILDEPTSALDLNHSVAIMKRIKKEIKENGITALMVLHDLNLASLFCDEIIMMKDGKVFKRGTPKEVITRENLMSVYQLDSNIHYTEEGYPYVVPKI